MSDASRSAGAASETFPADVPLSALEALDEATRAVAGVLEIEDVLQLIVDRVRALVGARYAALGILDPDGRIERFVTAGITLEERLAIGPPPAGHGLLGLLVLEGHALRIPNIAAHPTSVGFPPHHPPMTSFLGVPVPVKGRPIGNLYLTDKETGAEFTAADERLTGMFALHAGIAIDNARLHARVRDLAVVEERDRIGRDLHDGIIQSLYGLSLSLEDVPEMPPAEAEQRIDQAIDGIHRAIGDIRQFIHGLSAASTDGRDLPTGLVALAEEVRRNTLVEMEVVVDREADPALAPEDGGQLLQLVREALSNAARHAGATEIRVRLRAEAGASVVEVADDGTGFDPAAPVPAGHHGLANMRARADAIGAGLEVDSRPGAGARIIVTIPRPPARSGDTR